MNGKVEAVIQIGATIYLGGSFSSVAPTGGGTVTRNNIVAFNSTTGALSTTFIPSTDGEITSMVASADQQSLFIGGSFNTVNGSTSRTVAKLNVSNGALASGFTAPSLDARITDLKLSNNRLWIGGSFTRVGGVAQTALATLNPSTGARLAYMNLSFGAPRNGGVTQVKKFDITPDGSRLVAIGNFDTIGTTARGFLAMLDLTGPTTVAVADWATGFFGPACVDAFDTYMRDLDISPDGSYLVVSTTGAYGGASGPCDSTTRWELGATGTGITPTWTDYTGGDTTYGVAITGTAVYVGGHFRWQNNSFAGDAAGPGAVAREGIAALDPGNGLPFAWNPGRERGVGVFDMLATSTGLWVGSDTDVIGGETRRKISFFPLSGGTTLPSKSTGSLPNHVFLAGAAATSGPVLYRVNAGGSTLLSTDSGPDWSGDTSDSALRNSGSNGAGWGPVGSLDSTVPTGTPTAVFDSERWDPNGDPEMHWTFPVASGTPLQVRLYFANRCSCTSSAGSRKFSVAIDGSSVLSNYDIVADVGDNVGTMKAFPITSDGTVDIDFSHIVENPLINGIEIRRTDVTGPDPDQNDLQDTYLTTTGGSTVGTMPGGGTAWSTARGATMIGNSVYYGAADGSFTARTFNGTTFGPAVAVDTADQIVNLASWHSDVPNITGMFFTNSRLYYTLAGNSSLYYRYFTPSSRVVGAQRYTATGSVSGIDFSAVDGMFVTDAKLYFGLTGANTLNSITWDGAAPVAGTATEVSGPNLDGVNWRNRAMWLYTGSNLPAPTGPNQAPTAVAAITCTNLVCAADGTGSTDPEGAVAGYAWDFGDGGVATVAQPSHTYSAAGTYSVTLTVTDGNGATDADTVSTTVTAPVPPAVPITYVGSASANVNAISATVTVPAGAVAGDALLLFVTNSTSTSTPVTPAGWTPVLSRDLGGGNGSSQLYSRVAASGTGGSTVTVAMSAMAKFSASVVAYHGTGADPVASSASLAETVSRTAHTTPGGTVAVEGSIVVSYWADRSAATSSWSAPAGETVRTTSIGTGSGRISALLTDGGSGATAGAAAPLTATADSASGRAAMWTVILRPAP
ncbi:MAG TPA: PKD domain-containing protein [Kineosporiaceae bacterium]|nr:PKD domain-containing protein [Kineosporiaceae bacterium]